MTSEEYKKLLLKEFDRAAEAFDVYAKVDLQKLCDASGMLLERYEERLSLLGVFRTLSDHDVSAQSL